MQAGMGQVLLAVYDAACAKNKWPAALDTIAGATGSFGAALVSADMAGLPYRVQEHSSSYPDEAVEDYFRRFGHYDQEGWEHLVRKNVPGRLFADSEVWPDEAANWEREDFKFLRETYGVLHRGCALISQDRGAANFLTLQIGTPWADLSPDFWQAVRQSMPHLTKVLEIHRTMDLLRQRYQAALAALDHLCIGICVGDDRGRIALANREAKRIFSLGDGLVLGRDGALLARDEDVTQAIRTGILLATHTAEGKSLQGEMVLHCRRPSGAEALLIEICPLRDASGELESGFYGSMICIIDPAQTRQIKVDGMAKIFALSLGETEVCRQLIEGATNADIAEARNVSVETIRAQIKTAYAKMGVNNRIELIRKAVAVQPPIV